MAGDAVLGEPISGPIPCYQGNLQGISTRWIEAERLAAITISMNQSNLVAHGSNCSLKITGNQI